MFADLWNSAKDKYLLQQELLKQEKINQKKRLQKRELDRLKYEEKLKEFRLRKGTREKDQNILRQKLLKKKLNQNILRDIEIAKQNGITNILKCPKFIKFTKSRFKVDDKIKLYIEWELLKSDNLEKTQTIGLTFNYDMIKDTPKIITDEIQNDLKELKYWVGEDCKEYLYEYLTSSMI